MADDDDNLQLNELEEETPAPIPEGDGSGDATDTMGDMESELPQGAQDLEAVYDIPVQVSAVLGKATMQVSQLLKLC
jgi:flagellar motor switch protein FliN/FliY